MSIQTSVPCRDCGGGVLSRWCDTCYSTGRISAPELRINYGLIACTVVNIAFWLCVAAALFFGGHWLGTMLARLHR